MESNPEFESSAQVSRRRQPFNIFYIRVILEVANQSEDYTLLGLYFVERCMGLRSSRINIVIW